MWISFWAWMLSLTQAGSFGKLSDVLTSPAHDVYVTDCGAMIPVAGDYIIASIWTRGKITVRDVPGLIDDPNEKPDTRLERHAN